MDTADELYERLISPIEAKMVAIVSRIVGPGDEAADVLQETLAVVWERLRRIDRHPNPHAYILRICISRSYDALRRRGRRNKGLTLLLDAARLRRQSEDDHSDRHADREVIEEAIRSLPPHQAKAILLRIVDHAPYDVIGDILGCSGATARSHVSKGKVRLRELLADWERL